MRADAVWFSSTGKFFITVALKPGAVAVRVYMPTGRLTKRNSPLPPVVVVKVLFVPALVATTFALAITLLVLSTTTPEMSPVVAWGKAAAENRTRPTISNRYGPILLKPLPINRTFIFSLLSYKKGGHANSSGGNCSCSRYVIQPCSYWWQIVNGDNQF